MRREECRGGSGKRDEGGGRRGKGDSMVCLPIWSIPTCQFHLVNGGTFGTEIG